MGLRENLNFFIPMVYGLDIANYDSVSEQYQEWYTQEELQERFETVFKLTNDLFPYGHFQGFVWDDIKKRFKPTGTSNPTMLQQSRCSVLTCLLRAAGKEFAAKWLGNLTGKRYSKFEF
jgi:hypothetical protein